MIKKILSVFIISLGMSGTLFAQPVFDPKKDGWYFSNWAEQGEFDWDLFRETYLGIYPINDPVAAPLDAAFFELFKICAKGGHCGGMSVLALALFKLGGYFGFCSPANFYTGVKGPDRLDLHRAINVIHARQFSCSGITRFIDAVDRGTLENPEVAFDNVKEALGKGDYPVLWLSTATITLQAHTVIPYKTENTPTKKILYIWDPNNPYDDYPDRYDNNNGNKLEIERNGTTVNWSYTSGTSLHFGSGGWCLCVPMSDILRKSRHPFAVDFVSEAIRTLFVGGPGAAVSQIADEEGRHFYKMEKDLQATWSDVERDPSKRIPGLVRWPWLAESRNGGPRSELYFMRIVPGKKSDLTVTLSGTQYKAILYESGNLLEVRAESAVKAKDTIHFSRIGRPGQTLEITTTAPERSLTVRKLRTDFGRRNYRQFEVKNLTVEAASRLSIATVGDSEGLDVEIGEKATSFDLDIVQRYDGTSTTRKLSRLQTSPGKKLRIVPINWKRLETTEVEKSQLMKERVR